MVIPDKHLRRIIRRYKWQIGLEVNPASVDLTLGDEAIIYDWPLHYRAMWHVAKLLHDKERMQRYSKRVRKVNIADGYWLKPGEMALLHSSQYVHIPDDTAALLTLKSSRGREGFDHALAGWFDPGFEGVAVFEVYAHAHPVYLYAGMPFAQLIYFKVSDVVDKAYNGHYQGQLGATPSWRENRV